MSIKLFLMRKFNPLSFSLTLHTIHVLRDVIPPAALYIFIPARDDYMDRFILFCYKNSNTPLQGQV